MRRFLSMLFCLALCASTLPAGFAEELDAFPSRYAVTFTAEPEPEKQKDPEIPEPLLSRFFGGALFRLSH